MTKLRGVVVAVGLLGLSVVGAVPAQASSPANAGHSRDTVTVTGYNFEVNRVADVITGDPAGALRIVYTAGKPLTDGTVRVVFARSQWPTTLRTAPGFYGATPFSSDDQAAVSVLPAADLPAPAPSCMGSGPVGEFAASDWSVQGLADIQVVTVRHATCAIGAHLILRMKGITGPPRAGTFFLPVVATQPGAFPRVALGAIKVVPVPHVQLSVAVPAEYTAGQSFDIFVVATNGARPAVKYSGELAVISEPEDCTTNPPTGQIAAEMPVGRVLQTITVTFNQAVAKRLLVYDVSNRARPGVGPDMVGIPADIPGGIICPASFH